MADIKKVKVRVKQPDGSYLTLHPETQADITDYNDTLAELGAENVNEAIDKLAKKINNIPDSFVASVNNIDGKLNIASSNTSILISEENRTIDVKVNPQIIEEPLNNIYNELLDIKTDLNSVTSDLDDAKNHINELDENKQNKLTAGNHISIIDNVISAEDQTCKLGETFVTNVTVGNLKSGTQLNADMTISEILKMMLKRPEGSTKVYFGATTNIPTSLDGLDSKEVDNIIGKITHHISSGDPETEEGQYPVFACPVGYKATKWVAAVATEFPLAFTKAATINEYNIYYQTTQVYDEDLGGNDYIITIEEE